jgi:hypothetical protein
VIPKSTHRGRIEENAQIFDFALSDADLAVLDALDQTAGTDRARAASSGKYEARQVTPRRGSNLRRTGGMPYFLFGQRFDGIAAAHCRAGKPAPRRQRGQGASWNPTTRSMHT